jgi:fructokinase
MERSGWELSMSRFDVVTCGELLIDFVALETGVSLSEAHGFEKAAGGAPANVAVGLARLGHSIGFLGQIGDDEFGDFLVNTLRDNNVDVTGLRRSNRARTALAFVSLTADGERDFMFYRHPSADMLWQCDERDRAIAASGRIFHFGSISLVSDPSRTSTIEAIESARARGAVISFDPNLRFPLWPSAEAAREGILLGLGSANVVKMSREELIFTSGEEDIDEAARRLWHDQLRLLAVTTGAEGCRWFTPRESGNQPGIPITPVDTTGAGDAFVAGMLAGLVEADFELNRQTLDHIMRLANATGALTVTKRGAIPSLPTRNEVERFLATH